MENNNPYQTPTSTVNPPGRRRSVHQPGKVGRPRLVGAGRGASWLTEAFGLYKKQWLTWIVMFVLSVLLLAILIAAALVVAIIQAPQIFSLESETSIPLSAYIFSFGAQLIITVLGFIIAAGFILGAQAIDEGEDLTVGHLFAGFSQNTGTLAGLGIVYFVVYIPIETGVGFIPINEDIFPGISSIMPVAGSGEIAISFIKGLIVMGLLLPLLMAVWFAPALIVLGDKSVLESMKLSFIGCLKNILPFLVYGVFALILFILGIIPLGLGLLIILPVVYISPYTGYQDVYCRS